MNPFQLLEELLRFRRVSSDETSDLANYSHDDLCRQIEENIHSLLDSFEKYKHIAYLVQGPRDQGVDVLLKGRRSEEDRYTYVALQVKSYREVEDRDEKLSQKLKAGLVDATSTYGEALDRYYILLFGDAKKHEKRISAITAEFTKQEKVRVIGPRDLLAFLRLPDATIGAVVDRHLGQEDYVKKCARKEVAEFANRELYFLLICLGWSLENGTDLLPHEFFAHGSQFTRLCSNFGEDALEACMNRFEDRSLEYDTNSSATRIRLEHFPALRALYFDIKVRYGEKDHELVDHLYEFLRLEEDSASEASSRV
jgi:hypothetical protein